MKKCIILVSLLIVSQVACAAEQDFAIVDTGGEFEAVQPYVPSSTLFRFKEGEGGEVTMAPHKQKPLGRSEELLSLSFCRCFNPIIWRIQSSQLTKFDTNAPLITYMAKIAGNYITDDDIREEVARMKLDDPVDKEEFKSLDTSDSSHGMHIYFGNPLKRLELRIKDWAN